MSSQKDRKNEILLAAIKDYIKSAKPVSSKRLINVYGFKYSSATVRNLMAELENEGFLLQPHTSAGRIPSVKGYRYYVNAVYGRKSLDLSQWRFIIDHFSQRIELEDLVERTCRFIARLTSYMGVAIKYEHKEAKIKHIDLIMMKNSHLLVVIIMNNGDIVRERIKISKFDFDLTMLEKVMNKEFVGQRWEAVNEKAQHLRALGYFGRIFEEITLKLKNLQKKQRISLFYEGLSNLLNFPEFSQVSNFSGIFSALDKDPSALKEIGSNLQKESAYIAIGEEQKSLPIGEASLILAPYHIEKNIAGAIGIIGPMRMDYETTIATSECIAGNLSVALEKEL